MSILLTSKTVRVALNAGTYGGFTDQLTSGPVKFPFADLRIEVALFYGKTNTALALVDLSNIVSLTCTVKAVGAGDAAPVPTEANLMQAVVLAADFNAALTADQWNAIAGRHVAFDFTEAQVNNIPDAGKVWVVFTALLDTGKVIPVQFGTMEVVQDGYDSAGVAPSEENTSYTKAESLALFFGRAPVAASYRIKDDGAGGSLFQVKSATSGKFHTLLVAGAPGAEALTIGPPEV